MTKKRTGLTSRAYMGVEASTPPQLTMVNREPTANDYSGYSIGHIWIYDQGVSGQEEVWMLIDKRARVSTWIEFGAGGGAPTFVTDAGTAIAIAGVTNVLGGDNINTAGATDTVTINLDTSIVQPISSQDKSEGCYSLGANMFMHAYGTQNTFLGQSAGNFDVTPATERSNTGIGFQVLTDNTLGDYNVSVGSSSLATLTDGDYNVSVGAGNLDQATDVDFSTSLGGNALGNLLIGDNNIAIGYDAGINYVNNESSNILIGSDGVATEDNTIHIGEEGSGVGQQDACYIAGIYEANAGATTEIMTVGSDGKIGSTDVDLDGYLLISGNGASPSWSRLESGDGTITFNYPAANRIDLRSVGGGAGGATTFITDVASPAVIVGNNITMAGDGIIETDGTVPNTVTIGIPGDTHGDLLMTDNLGDTVWGNISSTGGSITITYVGSNINLEAVGAGGGANTFVTDAGNAVAVAGSVNVIGGDNMNTSGAGATLRVHLNESITLPDTNAAGTAGLYSLNSGTTYLHNYGGTGTDYNTFLGEDAGNLTMASSVDSVGIGYQSLTSLTTGVGNSSLGSGAGRVVDTGQNNVSVGLDSLYTVNSGSGNTTVGAFSLSGIVTGSNNTCLGMSSGGNCTASDSSNVLIANMGSAGLNNTIIIGTDGSGAGQQDTTFIHGIYGVSPGGGGVQRVTIDAAGQLGTTTDSGDITDVNPGSANMDITNPGGPVVTIDLGTNINLAGNGTFGGDISAVNATFTGIGGRGVVQSSAGGVLSSSEGSDGQLLISSSVGAPIWANITEGSGITVTNANNSITLTASGLDINTQAGTTYQLVLTDQGKEVQFTNGAAITLTVPLNATVAFPVGTQIILVQYGAGTVTVAGAIGVTINSAGGRLDLFEQYSAAALIKQGTDEWLLAGDIL